MMFLRNLGAILITFPYVAFILVFLLVFLWKKNKKTALQWSVNITNIFLIYAVAVMYSVNWPKAMSAWWWISLVFLLIGSLLGCLQWKLRGKISLKKISFSVWRLTFLVFGVTYVFLFSIGIWIKMQAI